MSELKALLRELKELKRRVDALGDSTADYEERLTAAIAESEKPEPVVPPEVTPSGKPKGKGEGFFPES